MAGRFVKKQRIALCSFYVACALFALAAGVVERVSPSYRMSLRAVAGLAATWAVLSLYQFFRTTDEFRQAINHRAVEFAFIGSLVVAVMLALLQSWGVEHISPYLLPALMVGLWSIGLMLSARRFE